MRVRVARPRARAAFLDKDGTLVVDVPFNVDPARVQLMPNAAAGAAMLRDLGYRLFVVSNQPGVARGYFSERALGRALERLATLLGHHGVRLDGVLFCPHDPRGSVAPFARACDCRKPAPGLLRRAAEGHGIDLAHSWLIGDILDDVEAGNRAGCHTALLDNGHETEWQRGPQREPEVVAGDLLDAARQIAALERTYADVVP